MLSDAKSLNSAAQELGLRSEYSVHVLAIEPYYGGSHRAFLDAVVGRSRHDWTLITGPARHWKWRMRNAPLALALQVHERLASGGDLLLRAADVVFCSAMLDLPQWRGFVGNGFGPADGRPTPSPESMVRIASLPAITYFHENQWTYPTSPLARDDAHYGYTNLLTALASDEVWFNSDFHRREFLQESRRFVARMPDARRSHDLDALAARSLVVPPGFETVESSVPSPEVQDKRGPVKIGWASRWEHDKRPDRFATLLDLLASRDLDFELILLGARPTTPPPSLLSIESRYGGQILFSGFAENRAQYEQRLREMDVIVSTAEHEFFGIAVCEAISAGAIPVLPDALSYPELVASRFRYRSLEQAADMIEAWSRDSERGQASHECRKRLRPFTCDAVISNIDDGIERVARSSAVAG